MNHAVKSEKLTPRTRWLGLQKLTPAPDGSGLRWTFVIGRVFVLLTVTALVSYAAGVTGIFLWLKYGREIGGVSILSVAAADVKAVKRAIAEGHQAKARAALAERNLQVAYLSYVSALRGDGTNVALRIEVAEFLASVGAGKQALSVLEDGAKNQPESALLTRRLLEMLRAQGRAQRVLELLKGPLGQARSGAERVAIGLLEAEALVNTGAPEAALQLLAQRRELNESPLAPEVKASALWALNRQREAVDLLAASVKVPNAPQSNWIRLYETQEAMGMQIDALVTAEAAVRRYPSASRVRLIHLGALRFAGSNPSSMWREAVNAYIGEFGSDSAAMIALAELCGRRGWSDLSLALFSNSVEYGAGARVLALAHADAVFRSGRIDEAKTLLEEIEPQVSGDSNLMIGLRRRQIALMAATGGTLLVREYARSLAVLLAGDPERLEAARRQYELAGLTDAANELRPSGERRDKKETRAMPKPADAKR